MWSRLKIITTTTTKNVCSKPAAQRHWSANYALLIKLRVCTNIYSYLSSHWQSSWFLKFNWICTLVWQHKGVKAQLVSTAMTTNIYVCIYMRVWVAKNKLQRLLNFYFAFTLWLLGRKKAATKPNTFDYNLCIWYHSKRFGN